MKDSARQNIGDGRDDREHTAEHDQLSPHHSLMCVTALDPLGPAGFEFRIERDDGTRHRAWQRPETARVTGYSTCKPSVMCFGEG